MVVFLRLIAEADAEARGVVVLEAQSGMQDLSDSYNKADVVLRFALAAVLRALFIPFREVGVYLS